MALIFKNTNRVIKSFKIQKNIHVQKVNFKINQVAIKGTKIL